MSYPRIAFAPIQVSDQQAQEGGGWPDGWMDGRDGIGWDGRVDGELNGKVEREGRSCRCDGDGDGKEQVRLYVPTYLRNYVPQ